MVGAHLLFDLVSAGEKVRALKRPKSCIQRTEKIFGYYSSDIQLLMQNIEWVEGDILEKDNLRGLLAGVDQIYHVAAMISFDPRKRETMIQYNCEGTANLADLALTLKIPKFCYVSSISAIGSPPEGTEANEDHPWQNYMHHSAYSESKYLAEMEVWRAIYQGLNAVIINPSVIIGPGNWNSGSPMLFQKVWNRLRFYTRGGTGFVDVRDVTAAMQQLMKDEVWEAVKNKRYILNSENVSYRELFNRVADNLKKERPKYFAGKVLLGLVWRLSSLRRFLTGMSPSITCEIAGNANKLCYFDGSRICRAIGFKYLPIDDSICNVSRLFLKDFDRK